MGEVLVVDDELNWLQLYEMALGDVGHSVRRASTGAETVKALAERPADVVILDVLAPPSGREVLHALRRRWPRLPVIVSSTHEECRSDPRFAGADAFWLKSGDVSGLVAAVEVVLAARSAVARVS